jgi:hypothetical protein
MRVDVVGDTPGVVGRPDERGVRHLQSGLTATPQLSTATGATRSPTPGPRLPERPNGRGRGEPVALNAARRVRRAALGNGPGAIPAPRPRPTRLIFLVISPRGSRWSGGEKGRPRCVYSTCA